MNLCLRAALCPLAALLLSTPASGFTIAVTSVYDEQVLQPNQVDFSRTSDGLRNRSLQTFSSLVTTAYSHGLGGVINFDLPGTIPSVAANGGTFTATYGDGQSLTITNRSVSIMTIAGPLTDRTTISGARFLGKGGTNAGVGGVGGTGAFVFDFDPGSMVWGVGFTLLGRTQTPDSSVAPIITLSDNTSYTLPPGQWRSASGNGTLDSFWGFELADADKALGRSITRVDIPLGGLFTGLDDLAFIIAPEPSRVTLLALAALPLLLRRRR
jgi:hypothetical protein